MSVVQALQPGVIYYTSPSKLIKLGMRGIRHSKRWDKAWGLRTSPVAQVVKNPPAMWKTWVQSLGWEDPLEKGTLTHSSILVWRIPWSIPWDHKELDTNWRSFLEKKGSEKALHSVKFGSPTQRTGRFLPNMEALWVEKSHLTSTTF